MCLEEYFSCLASTNCLLRGLQFCCCFFSRVAIQSIERKRISRKWCKVQLYNERLIGNRVWPIECYDWKWSWGRLKVTFAVLNLCNIDNSGNIACFNYSVFTHKLEGTRSLWFKLYCQKWTSQGHRQSCTVQLYTWKVVISRKQC